MTEVSIITPVYNGAGFILRTIETVKAQSFEDWEMLVVDDCSTDSTVSLLRSIDDPRLRIVRLRANSGPAVARNTAIQAAKGRFIAFLDGDDIWHPEKLERQIRFMMKKGYAFTYHNHQKVDENLKQIREFHPPETLTYRRLLRYNPLHTSSVMYDIQKLGKVYMPLIRKRQDYGLWFRLVKKADGHLLDEMLSDYVQMPRSVSRGKLGLIKYNWELYRKHEKMSLPKAAYCLSWSVFSKLSGIK